MVANGQRIVSRVLGGRTRRLSSAFAREALSWRFSAADRHRVARLLEKNNANTITRAELEELNTLVVLADVLDILHAQAALTLKWNRPAQTA